MVKAFRIPGVILLVSALVLQFLSSISLPYLTKLDVTRTHFSAEAAKLLGFDEAMTEVRFGVWAACRYALNGERTCSKSGSAYSVTLGSISLDTGEKTNIEIGSSWTRGLLIHPVAAGVTLLALGLALTKNTALTIVSSFVSFLAAVVTLIAFAIDLALYLYVRKQTKKLGVDGTNTDAGPAFWMSLVSLVLLLLSTCAVFIDLRKSRVPNYSKSERGQSFWMRFRRN